MNTMRTESKSIEIVMSGIVEWYNEEEGHGEVIVHKNDHVSIHHTRLLYNDYTPKYLDVVLFERSIINGKPQAWMLRKPETFKDIAYLLYTYNDKPISVKGSSRNAPIKSFNIAKQGLLQLRNISLKDISEALKYFIDFYCMFTPSCNDVIMSYLFDYDVMPPNFTSSRDRFSILNKLFDVMPDNKKYQLWKIARQHPEQNHDFIYSCIIRPSFFSAVLKDLDRNDISLLIKDKYNKELINNYVSAYLSNKERHFNLEHYADIKYFIDIYLKFSGGTFKSDIVNWMNNQLNTALLLSILETYKTIIVKDDQSLLLKSFYAHCSKSQILQIWRKTKLLKLNLTDIFEIIDELLLSDFKDLPESFVIDYYRKRTENLDFNNNLLDFILYSAYIIETMPNIRSILLQNITNSIYLNAILVVLQIDRAPNLGGELSEILLNPNSSKLFSQCYIYCKEVQKEVSSFSLDLPINAVKVKNIIQSTNSFDTRINSEILNSCSYMLSSMQMAAILQTILTAPRTYGIEINEALTLLDGVQCGGLDKTSIVSLVAKNSNAMRVYLWVKDEMENVSISDVLDVINYFSNHLQRQVFRKLFSKPELVTLIDSSFIQTILSSTNIDSNILFVCWLLSFINKNKRFPNNIETGNWIKNSLSKRTSHSVIDHFIEFCTGRAFLKNKNQPFTAKQHICIQGDEYPIINGKLNINGIDYILFDDIKEVIIQGHNYKYSYCSTLTNVLSIQKEAVPSFPGYCAPQNIVQEDFDLLCYNCRESRCYSPSQVVRHNKLEWNQYSIYDFLMLLNISFTQKEFLQFVTCLNDVQSSSWDQ